MMMKYGISEQATPSSTVKTLRAYSPRLPSANSISHDVAERFGSGVLFIVISPAYHAARCFFTIFPPIAAPIKAATITPATRTTDSHD